MNGARSRSANVTDAASLLCMDYLLLGGAALEMIAPAAEKERASNPRAHTDK
jgi:hypothetical protein